MKKFLLPSLGGFLFIFFVPMIMIVAVIGGDITNSGAEYVDVPSNLNSDLIAPIKKGQYIYFQNYGFYTGELSGAHYGSDLASPDGTRIYSVGDGEVMERFDGCENSPNIAVWEDYCTTSRGNHLIIKTKVNDDTTIYIAYYHMFKSSVIPKVGDQIKKGQFIGMVGNSGKSTGSHLHIEFQLIYQSFPSSFENRVDPALYLPLTPYLEYVVEDDEYHYIEPKESEVNPIEP